MNVLMNSVIGKKQLYLNYIKIIYLNIVIQKYERIGKKVY